MLEKVLIYSKFPKALMMRIGERFGDPVIGEEDGGTPADLVWVVDPIDGTVNYIHGSPRWCVSIALVEGGDIVSGVINAPDEGRLFSACRGQGARQLDGPSLTAALRTLPRTPR